MVRHPLAKDLIDAAGAVNSSTDAANGHENTTCQLQLNKFTRGSIAQFSSIVTYLKAGQLETVVSGTTRLRMGPLPASVDEVGLARSMPAA